jgi:nucleotide-binding universal stress UspA family protein
MSATKNNKPPRIVVGMDGSPSSRGALRWAVRQAGLTGGTVDAVIAWQIPAVLGGYGPGPMAMVDGTAFEDSAKQTLAEAISDVVGSGDSRLVRSQVVHGIAAQVLLDASAGADLLVVGSWGHGGFADVLLGSAGRHCLPLAHCPVVVMCSESAADPEPLGV